MSKTSASAGNKGDKDRSDCFVTVELAKEGGVQIFLTSKVEVYYGDSIRALCSEICKFFSVTNARITIEDKGALPFVIAARLEAAIKQLIESPKEFLLPMLDSGLQETRKDRQRFSRLYLPGNTPSLMINAGVHKPDAIILDLEDAVAYEKKPEARFVVRNALRNLDFMGVERMVRINPLPAGLEDLSFIVPHHVNVILLPKCESANQILTLNAAIDQIKKTANINFQIWLMPIIESALGVVKAFEIATAADNIIGMAIGLEDYTADLGVRRTAEGKESLFARSQVVNACKAAGIQAIDSVFSDVADLEALKENVLASKALGFEGMGCIHPRQIKVIHDNFAPDQNEVDQAKKIVVAFEAAKKAGIGVVALGTKMIDAPVVKRAQRTIDLAIAMNRLHADWMTAENNK